MYLVLKITIYIIKLLIKVINTLKISNLRYLYLLNSISTNGKESF